MAGKPKPGFYIAVFLVIAGLVGIGFWRFSGGKKEKSSKEMKLPAPPDVEAPIGGDIGLTASSYDWEPAQKLPEVKGSSNYKAIGDSRTVKFAINVWAGWAPIFYANGGMKAGKEWKGADGKPFKVELVLIDDPVAMRQAYVAGDVHIGWATVDMLPLLLEGMKKDSRVAPRVFQQIDWSNGGDGIVARDSIKTMSDLKGKSIVLAQNSPSHFFVLNALLNSGVQPNEVDFKFTKDAFQAAAAFNGEKSLSACVSWAPDIYKLSEKAGNRMMVTTATANKLIADVWFARADFAKDHPEIIEGLVRGIFDAMEDLKAEDAKHQVAKWMAEGYGLPEDEAFGMLGDAHWTNYAENAEFFLAANNPTNFERTFNTAYYLYKQLPDDVVSSPFVSFDSVVDFSVIKKLGSEPKYADQTSDYDVKFQPASADTIQAESPEILTKTVVIHFFPNSDDIWKKVIKKGANGKDVEVAYDPNVPFVIEEVGKLAGQYGAAQIVIEGHTDESMKGKGVPDDLVKRLSQRRAESVKKAVATKFPKLDPNQFAVKGMGWDRPKVPGDHAKNRRVEIKVYPAEAGAQ